MTTPCGESGNGGIGPKSSGGGAPGRNEQIAALYQQHKGALFGYCLGKIGDIDLANDMVQVTFCDAVRDWSMFDGGNAKAWLYRLARDNCNGHLRRKSTKEVSLPSGDIPLTEPDDWMRTAPDPALVAQDHSDDVLERVAIEEALQKLTENQRQIMAWRYVEGYNCREIAEKLDIGHGAVRERLRYARDAFKQAYAG